MFKGLLNSILFKKEKKVPDGFVYIEPKNMLQHQSVIGSVGTTSSVSARYMMKVQILKRATQGETFIVVDASNDGELDVMIKKADLKVKITPISEGEREIIFNPKE